MPKEQSREDASRRKPETENSLIGVACVICATTIVVVAFCMWAHQRGERRQLEAVIESHIKSLAYKRPSELSKLEWESAVAWTLNLHANSLLSHEANHAAIASLEQEIRERAEGKEVSLEVIVWIWNAYANISPHGREYQKWKPVMLEEIKSGGAHWSLEIP